MTPAKTATQIDRPERFPCRGVRSRRDARIPGARVWGQGASLQQRQCARRPSIADRYAHRRRAIEEVQLRGDMEASTDPINKVLGVWVTAGSAEGHSDGIAGSATPGDVTMVVQPDLPDYTHTQDECQISVLMDPS